MPIDIKHWKKFHIYDIFLIDSGSKFDKTKMNTDKPEINFIGRSSINNGITEKVNKINDLEPYKDGNMTLALGGAYLGSCFIQPKDFYTSQNVIVLIPKHNLTFNQKQFIASMIFRESQMNYCAFKDELNRHIKTDFAFYLPTKQNNEPDWEYMENYIKNIKSKVKDNFVNLNLIKNSNNYQKIDLSSWKEFNLNELFDIVGSKTTKKKVLESSGDGNYPYITTQSTNNSTAGYYNIFTEYGNCLTIDSAVLGTCFYQEKDFSASDHVEVLRPKFKINKFIALFFVTVINKIGKLLNYQYNLKRNQTVLRNEKLFLPVDNYDNPNWQYMENYIKKLSNDIYNN